MFVDHENKVVFVHNPKTGGRSISKFLALDDSAPFVFAHLPTGVIRKKIFQGDWSQFFSFCVVRNPWERYVSLHAFQRSKSYAELLRDNYSSEIAQRLELNDWIEFNLSAHTKSNWFGIDQCAWWRGVSKVYRFEELAKALDDLAVRFDLRGASPHENQNLESPFIERSQLNNRSIEIIAELERQTIEEFGYAP